MDSDGSIKYRYALDSTGYVRDVRCLQPETRRDGYPFRCLACGHELIPRLGRLKAKHFAHKTEMACSKETYLHSLAKHVFAEEYSKCLSCSRPFLLKRSVPVFCNYCKDEYGLVCEECREEVHDLTRYFDTCEIEKDCGDFRADVLLSSSASSELLLVEIAVTHECDPGKTSSGMRVLEIKVVDEGDVDLIRTNELTSYDIRIRLHNFKTRRIEKPIYKGDCGRKVIFVFVVHPSLKSILLSFDPEDAAKYLSRHNKLPLVELIGAIDEDPLVVFRNHVRKAHFAGIPIKNCFICRYHGGDGFSNAIFCKCLKESVGSNQAVDCEYYRPMRSIQECIRVDERNDQYVRNNQTELILKRVMGPIIG